MRNISKWLCFLIGVTGLVILGIYLIPFTPQKTIAEISLAPSIHSGFYNEDQTLEFKAPADVRIYYTENGSEPVPGDENTYEYTEPLSLLCDGDLAVYTIRAIGQRGTEKTKVQNFSFFLGPDIENRFDCHVVNIIADEEDLYGYEDGILVEGKLRDDFIAENPGEEVLVKSPAGYNQRGPESERPITLQIFSPDGNQILEQNCGVRVSGNYTRGKTQKSLQFFARSSYDTNGMFHAALFPHQKRVTDQTISARSNRLLLRNSGDDFNHGFIRDSLIGALAGQYGFPFAYGDDQPAAVFIDNVYQGFYWLREPFQSGMLKELYGMESGSFETLRINEFTTSVITAATYSSKNASEEVELTPLEEEYQSIYDDFKEADMNDEETYRKFCQLVDVDNYLTYYAMELFIGNKDWPYNNVKAYRYVSENGHYEDEGLLDGRYRYLLFDTDYSMFLNDRFVSYDAAEDNLTILLNNAQSPIFSRLMGREDCRVKFVTLFCDIMSGAFSYEKVAESLFALESARENELQHFLTDSDFADAEVTMESIQEESERILDFAKRRPETMYQAIEGTIPVSLPYTLQIEVPENTRLSLNSLSDVGSTFSGRYYGSCGLSLHASTDVGHVFRYFLIGGRKFEDPDVELTPHQIEGLLNGGDVLPVQIVSYDAVPDKPIIRSIYARKRNDSVTLFNPYDHEISLKGYYLTDDLSRPKQTILPDRILYPGESFTFYGVKNPKADFESKLTFNLSPGETIFLIGPDGSIAGSVNGPGLGRKDSIYEMDLYTGDYREVIIAD